MIGVDNDLDESNIMMRPMISKIILFAVIIMGGVIADITTVLGQNCPDDILSNGKYFFTEKRLQDSIATFKSITLMFPASVAAEEAHYMIVAAYRQLAERQRNAQWLSKARDNIRIYKNKYPNGRFASEIQAESDGVEQIEAQLTGVSKGMFITLTSIAIGSVVLLGVAFGR